MIFLFPSIKANKLSKSDFGYHYTSELDLSTYLRLTNGTKWFKIEVRLFGFGIKYNWSDSNENVK